MSAMHSDEDSPIISLKTQCIYYIQYKEEKAAQLILVGGCCSGEVAGCHHPGGGNCLQVSSYSQNPGPEIDTFCTHWIQLKVKCSLTFKFGPVEGFAIPLSRTQDFALPIDLILQDIAMLMSIYTCIQNVLTPSRRRKKAECSSLATTPI